MRTLANVRGQKGTSTRVYEDQDQGQLQKTAQGRSDECKGRKFMYGRERQESLKKEGHERERERKSEHTRQAPVQLRAQPITR